MSPARGRPVCRASIVEAAEPEALAIWGVLSPLVPGPDPEASQPRSWGTRESARTSGSTNQNLVRGPCKYAQDRSERISPIRFQRLYP